MKSLRFNVSAEGDFLRTRGFMNISPRKSNKLSSTHLIWIRSLSELYPEAATKIEEAKRFFFFFFFAFDVVSFLSGEKFCLSQRAGSLLYWKLGSVQPSEHRGRAQWASGVGLGSP